MSPVSWDSSFDASTGQLYSAQVQYAVRAETTRRGVRGEARGGWQPGYYSVAINQRSTTIRSRSI